MHPCSAYPALCPRFPGAELVEVSEIDMHTNWGRERKVCNMCASMERPTSIELQLAGNLYLAVSPPGRASRYKIWSNLYLVISVCDFRICLQAPPKYPTKTSDALRPCWHRRDVHNGGSHFWGPLIGRCLALILPFVCHCMFTEFRY